MPYPRRSACLLLLLLVLIVACRGDDKQAAAPTEATSAPTSSSEATPAPAVTATPAPRERIAGVEVVPVQTAGEIDLPADLALIVTRACSPCENAWRGVARAYRDPASKARADLLREPSSSAPRADPSFLGIAARDDGAEIVVSVCTRGSCGPLGQPTADARSTLYRSIDGGVSWTALPQEEGVHAPLLIVRDQVLVSGPWRADGGAAPLRLLPSGAAVQKPQGADPDWPTPAAVLDGELIWFGERRQRLLKSDGSTLLTPAMGTEARIVSIAPGPRANQYLLGWQKTTAATGGEQPAYVGVVEQDGKLVEAYAVGAQQGVWRALDDQRLLGTTFVSTGTLAGQPVPPAGIGVPMIIERGSGRVSLLSRPFASELGDKLNTSILLALQRGPFARVVNTGDCLNIRSAPDRAAPSGGCAADGVLLRLAGESREAGSVVWQRVTTPAGISGWASAEFMEK